MSGTQAESLLIEAVNQTDARCVDTLLCQGANPNTITRDGVAAVQLAAGKESERGLRCLRLILQHGADANLRTSEDLTPLHIAASWGCFQNLRLLLRNGGDPNLKDQDGNKPSDLAEQEENSKCASLLQEYETQTSLEEHDLPKFQYSILSGPSVSDSTLSLEVSSVFDHPEPLSSTRLSSRMSRESQMFCQSDAQPLLSSTSVSVLDNKSDGCPWRKSVTFREPRDCFPASSPERSPDRSADVTLNLSDYSEFLGSERMATVFQNQGIDVTYPDDVFIFSKEANELQDEFEKTVVGPGLHHHHDDDDDDDDDDDKFKSTVQPPVSSGSSEYNSCDSVPYTSPTQTSTENIKPPSASDDDGKRTDAESHSHRHQVTQLHFIPSPFVTGRTRSRQSRCSQRMSSSLSSSSSLFDQTLPNVTRSRRNTLRSPCPPSKHSICEETSDMSSLNLSDGDSQADTHLLPDSMADTVIIPESCQKETDAMGDLTSEESRRTESGNSTASLPEYGCESPEMRKNVCGSSGLTGCTPRYSMSRLSGHTRRRTLADISVISGQTSCSDPVEYLYTDSEEGHELIETHVPVTSNSSLCSSEDTLLYDWRSLQITNTNPVKHHHDKHDDDDVLSGLTDQQLRNKLVQLGEDPGPINTQTRPLYLQKYKRSLQKTRTSHTSQSPASHLTGYSGELEKALDRFILPDCQVDELALCQQFDQADQNKRWREGFIKSSFNYLLLDPRVTMNLPYRSQSMSPKECFRTFINAVFYIGKGKRSRPYSHLYEALEYFKGDKTSKKLCSKVQHILQVWNSGNGVISLHCFQNVIAVEAYTREACMVDAVGLKMLTNQKRGDYYGVVSTWPVRRKRELGVHLLYRTMQIFLAEGERQLRPADIR
ncbi:ankyrin repeat and LEM domain-containing protein 1 isoform X2 [Triplophysa rosa]|uniref:ankyrin repeat and LEM domain-containing protein 1 isoform X2 n=1 Tax=Triplophysa rosa TaxID=992332 RepID=UPI0025460A18|nr:ankyrin repeat and LEM domain-containing protein 1 isoform X2 [Triplophysa rosa]